MHCEGKGERAKEQAGHRERRGRKRVATEAVHHEVADPEHLEDERRSDDLIVICAQIGREEGAREKGSGAMALCA